MNLEIYELIFLIICAVFALILAGFAAIGLPLFKKTFMKQPCFVIKRGKSRGVLHDARLYPAFWKSYCWMSLLFVSVICWVNLLIFGFIITRVEPVYILIASCVFEAVMIVFTLMWYIRANICETYVARKTLAVWRV